MMLSLSLTVMNSSLVTNNGETSSLLFKERERDIACLHFDFFSMAMIWKISCLLKYMNTYKDALNSLSADSNDAKY